MTKHTQGNWVHCNNGIIAREKDGSTIAVTYHLKDDINEKEEIANAILIANAPELLTALKETLKQLNAPDCPSIPDGAMVRGRIVNAINKAEGK